MLLENRTGNYSFIRGIGPFSAAVKAPSGFELVHARFLPLVALARGYQLVEQHLQHLQRPLQALAGMELRLPQPLTREAFDQFNAPYIEQLKKWGLEIDGANPVTRTNVAYASNAVAQPMLAGFYYSAVAERAASSFVLSGAPEIASRDGGVQIVARGDTSIDGLQSKVECIMQVLEGHLKELQLGFENATAVNLYTVHDIQPVMASSLLSKLGGAAHAGITWHYSRPPVNGLEVEIDMRAVYTELVLAP